MCASIFNAKNRTTLVLCVAFCAATFLVAPVSVAVQQKKVKGALREKDARRAISTLTGVELPTSAVRVLNINSTSASAEVTAAVKTAFRFRRSGEGKQARWVVAEVRTAERRWEDLELLGRILDPTASAHALLSDLETLAAELEVRQLARRKSESRKDAEDSSEREAKDAKDARDKSKKQNSDAPSLEEASARAESSADEKKGADADELRRGAVVVKSLSALHSSATVEAEIEAAFRLTKETGNKWRVREISIAGSVWKNVDELTAAMNAEKASRARAEMETLRAALESFRRERGAYVVAVDHTVLVDFLSPRHLPRIIRIDPWHRPYRYAGTRQTFTLRSDGADGKEGTADDVTLTNAT